MSVVFSENVIGLFMMKFLIIKVGIKEGFILLCPNCFVVFCDIFNFFNRNRILVVATVEIKRFFEVYSKIASRYNST